MLTLGLFAEALKLGAGFLAVSFVNDTYATPAVESLVPALENDHTLSKAADAATCAGVTAVLSSAGRLINREVGRVVLMGGLVATALKTYTIAIPGVEAKVTVPNPLNLIRAQQAIAAPGASGASATPALSAGTAAPQATTGQGLPAPLASNLDVGF